MFISHGEISDALESEPPEVDQAMDEYTSVRPESMSSPKLSSASLHPAFQVSGTSSSPQTCSNYSYRPFYLHMSLRGRMKSEEYKPIFLDVYIDMRMFLDGQSNFKGPSINFIVELVMSLDCFWPNFNSLALDPS